MPTNYVEDYEQVTGEKISDDGIVGTKVVTAPESKKPAAKTVAEVK